jgi:hypothetical protein
MKMATNHDTRKAVALRELESQMSQKIIATVCGQDESPQKVTQQLHCSIQRCTENCVSDAVQLVVSKLQQDHQHANAWERQGKVNAANADANAGGEEMGANEVGAADADAVDADADEMDESAAEDALKQLLSKHVT